MDNFVAVKDILRRGRGGMTLIEYHSLLDEDTHEICQLFEKDESKPDEGIRFQPTEFPPFKLADEENRGSPPKPDADVPLGVTCHYERDDSGQWWTVWSGDFPGDKPGRKLVEDSLLLEMGYQHAKSERPKPDEGRLLSPEYLDRFDDEFWANCDFYGANSSRCEELKEAVAKAQLAKEQRYEQILLEEFTELLIKEKTEAQLHEQARVERIFKEIVIEAYKNENFRRWGQRMLISDWWQEFKKREGAE